MNNWQCFIKGCWETILHTFPTWMSGHSYIEVEHHKNVEVLITKCERCGKVDISWGKNIQP